MLTTSEKQEIIKDNQINGKDVGSTNVQIALLTARIQQLTKHLIKNKKDKIIKRSLSKIVAKRKNFLSYLREKDLKGYQDLVAKLKIRG